MPAAPFSCVIRVLLCLASFLLVAPFASSQIADAIALTEDTRSVIKTNATVVAEHSWRAAGTYVSTRGTCQFLNTRHFTLSTNLRYSFLDMSIPSHRLPGEYASVTPLIDGSHHVFNTGVNLSYRVNIGRIPFFSMGMMSIDFSPRGFEHVGGVLVAGILVKGNASTIFGVGLIGLLNSTSRWPVFPLVVFTHKFSNRLSFGFMGSSAMFSYSFPCAGKLSAGMDLDLKKFYFRAPASTGLPRKSRYQKTLVRPQLKYSSTFFKKLAIEAVAGVEIKVSSSVGGVTGRTKFFDVDVPAAPFARLSAQYNF